MAVDPKFIIERFGKPFVLFAGLLDLAHQRGLVEIRTEVCRDLSDPKEQFWVVYARGRFSDENGGREFSGYGDASPASSQMKGAYLRHAETRAVARMLRMATNVGMTAFEELSGNEEDLPAAPAANGKAAVQRSAMVSHRPASPPAVATSADDPVRHGPACAVCGEVLGAQVYRASMKNFEQPLCLAHGKERLRQQQDERLRVEAS